ncbi:MAG: HEAT repeat domain-containing protein [Phycisphaerales bacterium]|nr:HEAT repeat domain-containing protein [Phycisphaerales bacterium]
MLLIAASLALAAVPDEVTANKDPNRVVPNAGQGMQVSEWASHPLVHDPVAIDIDPQGRVYVAETGRQDLGVVDNRSSPFWLMEDLAAQTTADRLAYFEKYASMREGGMEWYSNWSDQIRRVSDEDGDGLADTVTDFAGPFNDPLDGTGAGVLWRDGGAWYTCIPHLWRLEDADGDGVAEQSKQKFSGFGVRTALSGHDMHGLVIGPDGRLYWSIGDRGYSVTLPDGSVHADPHSGAIFRCEQDGSDFEVFATGLRNPQEIAFNEYGDLFTGDNNSDSVDRARFLYLPQGAEIGWDMAYQTLGGNNERGPWVQEGLWRPDHEGRPAWSIPPLENIGAGPSGFMFIDGDAVPEHFRGRLLMCDFRGSPQHSLVHAVKVERSGAGYEVVDNDPIINSVLTTDIDQAWDGSMLVSDWVIGWDNTKTGRLWRLEPEGGVRAASAAELARIAAEGFDQQDTDTLKAMLGHADHRGRTEAHLALAKRGNDGLAALTDVLGSDAQTLPRIHGVWGLWALARWSDDPDVRAGAIDALVEITWDEDAEVRAQVARVLGDLGDEAGQESLAELVFDESPRTAAFACAGLGSVGGQDDMDAIAEVLWSLEDEPDPFLRHAAVMGLAGIGDRERLLELLGDTQPTVRLGALLALRKLRDPAVAMLLRDQDAYIAAEAARAVHDAEIDGAMDELAAAASAYGADPSRAGDSAHDINWARWDRKTQRSVKLADDALFNGEPVDSRTLAIAQAPSRVADNYIARMQGTFTPPMSGDYQFLLNSDDEGLLRIKVGDKWTTAAKVRSWVAAGVWQERPEQVSAPITLEAGVPVEFDARHREGGGNDYLAIGWIRPDGVMEAPIGGVGEDVETSSIVRRAVEAAVRDGSGQSAAAVARVALNDRLPESVRVDALQALEHWGAPPPRDRVTGRWRPIESRDTTEAAAAVAPFLPPLASVTGDIGSSANAAARALGVPLDPAVLQATVADSDAPVSSRIDALRSLAASGDDAMVEDTITTSIEDGDPQIQATALELMHTIDPERATEIAGSWIDRGALRVAAVEQFGRAEDARSLRSLEGMQLTALPPSQRLDLLEARLARGMRVPSEDRYAAALHGGDPIAGEQIVRFHASAQCIRCHAFDGVGGIAGPDLSDVGLRLDRAQLLQSLLDPQTLIAEGFGEASAMPAMQEHLTPRQVRDVVAWLATRRSTN